ncbi:Importin subunit beta [Trichoplax sp. H2]|nr:Importin subunit beta [Trichoplax sp. H2]|eukprot:RDD45158.1 Importin subunit beta [Trichoplax sp. H2]
MLIKNYLIYPLDTLKERYYKRWKELDRNSKDCIKTAMLQALDTESSRPSYVTECIGYVVYYELLEDTDPKLIPALAENMINKSSSKILKESSAEAIGHIFRLMKNVENDYLILESDHVLAALLNGINWKDASQRVQNTIMTALSHFLTYVKENIKGDAIKNTLLFHQEEDEVIDMKYIKYKIIPERDDDIFIENNGVEHKSNGSLSRISNVDYVVKNALGYMVPTLLELMAVQDDLDCDDDFLPFATVRQCFHAIGAIYQVDVFEIMKDIMKDSIHEHQFQCRAAAVIALGSFSEFLQINKDKHQEFLNSLIQILMKMIQDDNEIIRQCVVWALGKIARKSLKTLERNVIESIVDVLMEKFHGSIKVTASICKAFTSLGIEAYRLQGGDPIPYYYRLSLYYEEIVMELLHIADKYWKMDGKDACKMFQIVYQSLQQFIQYSPIDCYDDVKTVATIIKNKLRVTLREEKNEQDHVKQVELQCRLCEVLQKFIQRAHSDDIAKWKDGLISLIISVFNSSTDGSGNLQSITLSNLATLAERIRVDLSDYIKHIYKMIPCLIIGLKDTYRNQVFISAVRTLKPVCRKLRTNFVPYCFEIITILLNKITDIPFCSCFNQDIIAALGNIAESIGMYFESYLQPVLEAVDHVAVNTNPGDLGINSCQLRDLRTTCLETYKRILSITVNRDLIRSHIGNIVKLIDILATSEQLSREELSNTAQILRYLSSKHGNSTVQSFLSSKIIKWLQSGIQDIDHQKTAYICRQTLDQLSLSM